MNNRKGFTLIEMVVVLAIISILVATAYPQISGYIKNNREQYREDQEYIINKTLMQYYAFVGNYCTVTCGAIGVITADNAALLFNELRRETGVTIGGAYDYVYTNTSHEGPGMKPVREIEVDFSP